jgi:glycosyltransferase involved in cell wall biosynthesis
MPSEPHESPIGAGVAGARIVVMSRCARTLFTFRRTLIHALIDRGAQLQTLGAAGEGFEARLESEGIPFRSVPVARRGISPLADLALLVRLVRIFRRERLQLLHAFTIKPAIFGTLAAAWAGVPIRIVTITGLGYAFTTAPAPLRFLVELLYRVALRRAHVVFFQNADDRELFIGRGLVEPSRTQLVSGSGVDLERFAVRPLPRGADGVVTVLMIARLLREKGVLEYLEAARTLKQIEPRVRLRLLGGTDPRNPSSLDPQQLRELRASPDLTCIEEVDDVRPHIESADIVVLPSYREGLPRALLEAAAMGRPLVATAVAGCRDVVEDGLNGYLVPVADAQALAMAVAKLASDPQRMATMGRHSRRRAEQRFDERLVIHRTLKTYEELLRSKVG